MSDHSAAAENPGVAGAIAAIEKRNRVCREFVPGANYHICFQCGKSRDEHAPRTVGDVIGNIARRFDAAAERGQS